MKRNILLACIGLILFASCKDNDSSLGSSVMPEDDSITVCVDTFHLQTSDFFVDSIFLQNDTFLLGEIYNQRFGTTKADLFFQVAPPVNYRFPTTNSDSIRDAQPDSLVLYMYYYTWDGAKNSPLEFCLYEIDKKTIDYTGVYYSNLKVDDYTTVSDANLIGKKVMTSIDFSQPDSILEDSTYVPYIKYTLEKKYAEQFFNLDPSAYASVEAFQNEFKGFYITTDYGSSTMLHLSQIDMRLYYHYTRIYAIDNEVNTDTVTTWVNYSANNEVRQLNRIEHTNRTDVIANLSTIDSLNFLKSPAGIYTNVAIPVGKMLSTIESKIGDKHLSINNATLDLEIVKDESAAMNLAKPEYLLLLRRELLADYFLDKGLPTSIDSTAVIGYLDDETDCYSFDLAYLLNVYLNQKKETITEDKVLDMVVLPIDAISSSSEGYITSVSSLFKLSGIAVRSGTNTFSPMRIKLRYSGF